MTHLLVSKGLPVENITILEKDSRIGGKTVSVKSAQKQITNPRYKEDGSLIYGNKKKKDMNTNGLDVYHELGTCYLSPGYFACRKFLKELQALSKPGDVDITKEVAPDSYAIEGSDIPDGNPLNLDEWVEENSIQYLGSTKQNLLQIFPFSFLRTLLVIPQLLEAKRKYCFLHKKFLGEYYFTVPPKPLKKDMDILSMPFLEFLELNELESLGSLFSYAMTAQGYGILSTTPTYWGMVWMTPDLLNGYFEWHQFFEALQSSFLWYNPIRYILKKRMKKTGLELEHFKTPRKGMLVSGWGSVWDRVVSVHNLEKRIKYKVDIKGIKRKGVKQSEDNKILFEQGGKNEEINFDFLVIAAPLRDFYEENRPVLLNMELDEEEERILLDKDIVASKFRTTLFQPKSNGLYSNNHLRIFIDGLFTSERSDSDIVPGHGDVFGVRDSYKAVQPNLSTPAGHDTDPLRDIPREKMCYQYYAPQFKSTEEERKKKCEQFFNSQKTDMGKYDTLENVREKDFTYFTHFEGRGFREGKLWDLLDRQGKNNTFFVHASNNFESVLDIVNYNNILVDGITGLLNSTQKPLSDARPEFYQRPWNFVFSIKNLGIDSVFVLLSKVLQLLWFIILFFIDPVLENLFWRKFRVEYLKEFHVEIEIEENQMTLKQFVNHLPGVKNFEEREHRFHKSKNKYGNVIDHALEKYQHSIGLSSEEAAVKNLSYIQLNVTDARRLIRESLFSEGETSVDGYFHNIIAALAVEVQQFWPSLYTYVLTCLLAINLHFLTGFSYRVEDEKAGGLRVEKCKILEYLVTKFGLDLGEKIWTNSFKIILEETLRKQGMDIEIQADFMIKKPGRGYIIRMQEPRCHAYSDHSIWSIKK
eukprot:augustus_masked-scaffold_6-processed-gene-2.46-mRNA-1 protein AED:0.26 eAED:0.41 QI:0/-1/0/1/-1/1/1/0/868